MWLLKIVTVLLVAVAMDMVLAHALELPGKLRLPKDQYLAVQAIYYPGFRFGGVAEPLSIAAVALLALLTPSWCRFLAHGECVHRAIADARGLLDRHSPGE